MTALKWVLIIIGTVAGVITPWHFQVVVMLVLLLAYAACHDLTLPNIQILLASLYGGLATGLGMQFLVAYGIKGHIVPMVVVPLLIWLVLRIIFYGVETKYTLTPTPALALVRAEDQGAQPQTAASMSGTGTSAWAGDSSGQSSVPDADGRYARYEFYGTGEIAMGGPTYGEAIFSNGCAFTDVGPSIAISDDGRYAAMTSPSRSDWGLLIADLRDKRAYDAANGGFWEIDRIENNVIYGRESPLTSNTGLYLSIDKALAAARELPMVNDDGWWVIDHPDRKPFPRYGAVTVASGQGTHRVTFVPDLAPFKKNPFWRNKSPAYTVLVDDELLELSAGARAPRAVWIDGAATDSLREGRFLALAGVVIDFKDAASAEFSVRNHSEMSIKACDGSTSLNLGVVSDAGDGCCLVRGTVMPRSTSWNDAEYAVLSSNHPWDEEDTDYWDAKARKRQQSRTRVERHVEYEVDLDCYRVENEIRNCTTIELINRGNPIHQARLAYAGETDGQGQYSAYTCTTSCGLVVENVTHEAAWSHCGRYLALVHFERPPNVPHRISILDFKSATLRTLTGRYVLPSFIWFDDTMLELTHIVGVTESIAVGPGRVTEERFHIDQSTPVPYDLLIGNIKKRRAELEQQAKSKARANEYASGSVSQIAQHCILFAPEFDQPVLQPPTSQTSGVSD